jgi:hypothetical protein
MSTQASIVERLRFALAQIVNDYVDDETRACAAVIADRVRDAEKSLQDHASDPIEVRRELAAYERGLRDAGRAVMSRLSADQKPSGERPV